MGELGYRLGSRGWIPSISALRLIGAVPSEWWESSGIDWVVGAGFPLLTHSRLIGAVPSDWWESSGIDWEVGAGFSLLVHSGSLAQCPVIVGRARV